MIYFIVVVFILIGSMVMMIKGHLVGIPIFFFCVGWMLGALEGFGKGRT